MFVDYNLFSDHKPTQVCNGYEAIAGCFGTSFLKLAECQHALDTKGAETEESHVGSFAS